MALLFDILCFLSQKYEPNRRSFCVYQVYIFILSTIVLLNQQLRLYIRLRGFSNILSGIIHQKEKKVLNDLFFTTMY